MEFVVEVKYRDVISISYFDGVICVIGVMSMVFSLEDFVFSLD